MNARPPNTFEEGPELIPTHEEVRSVFEQLIGEEGRGEMEREEIVRIEDERGLCVWGIKAGDREYLYVRKGDHEKRYSALETVINVVLLDNEGHPVGGHSVANFVGGKWEMIL
ncbi:MAG: hypothetical protein HYS43_01470 [Candidatus Liptonbacteria bacterium]|nr:hypothetical protein [Candidatus Liptonbacteria bacterium]